MRRCRGHTQGPRKPRREKSGVARERAPHCRSGSRFVEGRSDQPPQGGLGARNGPRSSRAVARRRRVANGIAARTRQVSALRFRKRRSRPLARVAARCFELGGAWGGSCEPSYAIPPGRTGRIEHGEKHTYRSSIADLEIEASRFAPRKGGARHRTRRPSTTNARPYARCRTRMSTWIGLPNKTGQPTRPTSHEGSTRDQARGLSRGRPTSAAHGGDQPGRGNVDSRRLAVA